MTSGYEDFWNKNSFALVGHSGSKKKFPGLTYAALKKIGKTVYAVDPGADQIDGDKTYADLASLPDGVEAAILELPKEETKDWVGKVADAGIKNLWIHMKTDTPEALALAKEKGLNVLSGTCAVMYVTQGFTHCSIHKWIFKLLGKY